MLRGRTPKSPSSSSAADGVEPPSFSSSSPSSPAGESSPPSAGGRRPPKPSPRLRRRKKKKRSSSSSSSSSTIALLFYVALLAVGLLLVGTVTFLLILQRSEGIDGGHASPSQLTRVGRFSQARKAIERVERDVGGEVARVARNVARRARGGLRGGGEKEEATANTPPAAAAGLAHPRPADPAADAAADADAGKGPAVVAGAPDGAETTRRAGLGSAPPPPPPPGAAAAAAERAADGRSIATAVGRPAYPVKHSHAFSPSSKALDMCNKLLWSTLNETTRILDDGTTFVITGDIDDLWLRDSAAQIHPYIAMSSPNVNPSSFRVARRIVTGLIKRHAFYVRHDPWANAFRVDTTYVFNEYQKSLGRHDYISTWNYELDSGCYFLRMLYFYYLEVPDDPTLKMNAVKDAVRILVKLWRSEQRHEEDDVVEEDPLFDCLNCGRPYRYKELSRDGKGSPTSHTGMSWTGFRPSDDFCKYHFHVPSNMFAVVALQYAAELSSKLWNDEILASDALSLASEIDAGINEHGVVRHPKYGKIYAYEVDGLGNSNLMDDANVPSLLSAPYLGYDVDETIYENTRKFVLSEDDPYYHVSRNGKIKGIGSPHMEKVIKDNVWPMGQIMQGLTSDSLDEKLDVVDAVINTDGGKGRMHESYDPNNPKKFTRKWFTWPEALFAELVMSVTDECGTEGLKAGRDRMVMPKVRATERLKGPGSEEILDAAAAAEEDASAKKKGAAEKEK